MRIRASLPCKTSAEGDPSVSIRPLGGRGTKECRIPPLGWLEWRNLKLPFSFHSFLFFKVCFSREKFQRAMKSYRTRSPTQQGQEGEGNMAQGCFSDFTPQPGAPKVVMVPGECECGSGSGSGSGEPAWATSPRKPSNRSALTLQLSLATLTSTTTPAWELQLHFLAKTTNSGQ